MITRIDQARPAVTYTLLLLLLAAVFVPMSHYRLVDGDEGTYLLDARLVMQGQLPFHDLYWPQMFLTPYLYGLWMTLVVGPSWYGARLLSALAAIALGLLLFRQVRHLTGRPAWGVLAVLLFAFSSLEFGWLPLIKTFAFGTLALFAAYAVLTLSQAPTRWFYCGLLLGLAIDIRLYVLVVVPVFLVELYLDEWHDARRRAMEVARFAVGLALALLPNQFFYLIDPETFLFNIIGVHALRTPAGFLGLFQQKLDLSLGLLGINRVEGVVGFQFAFLFLLASASWISCALTRRRLPLSSMIFVLLALASLMPTPALPQYFSMTVPFLVVDAVVFVASLAAEGTGRGLRTLFAVGAAAYVLVSPLDVYRYTRGGVDLPGIFVHGAAEGWRIPTIRAVARAIDSEVRPGRPLVIAFWPGYFVETRARVLPRMENHFTLEYSRDLPERDIEKFKFMSYPELARNLRRHTVDVVVLGNITYSDPEPYRRGVRDWILRSGYVLVRRIADCEIYKLPESRR